MFLIEKRIFQDEIYFMDRQVIILCDLKIDLLRAIYKTIEKTRNACVACET